VRDVQLLSLGEGGKPASKTSRLGGQCCVCNTYIGMFSRCCQCSRPALRFEIVLSLRLCSRYYLLLKAVQCNRQSKPVCHSPHSVFLTS